MRESFFNKHLCVVQSAQGLWIFDVFHDFFSPPLTCWNRLQVKNEAPDRR